jgi:hypothetical protein
MEFASWLSPEFKRLKKEEAERRNELTEWNNNRWLSKVNFKLHTDAIQKNIIPTSNVPKHKEGIIYANESEMLNKVVFDITSKDFKERNPQYINSNMREEIATTKQLQILANLESYNATLIRDGLTQKQRFDKLTIEAAEQRKSIKDNNFRKKKITDNQKLFNEIQESTLKNN